MKRGCGFLAALALALASGGVSADARTLAGVWLIEPPYFDPLVDQGLVTPEFPVLVIRADGRFTLFRVATHCDMLPESEEAKPGDETFCRRALERARADLGTLASVSAAGRWRSSAAGKVQFDVEERGSTPAYFKALVDSVRKDLQAAAAKVEKGARDEFTRRQLQETGARELRKLENFYTSAYVLHGAPLGYSRDGAFLRLEGEANEQLDYRRVEPAMLQEAVGFLVLADVSAARYFRCLVDHLQRSPAGAEQRQLGGLGRDAIAASRDGKLGAYLGCPARDQM